MSIKIASINIERSLHLPRVEAFIKHHQPDVLCLQELCERDIPFFEKLMGGKLFYAPMMLHPSEQQLEPNGIGIIAGTPLENSAEYYYSGQRTPVTTIEFTHLDTANGGIQKSVKPESVSRVLIAATVQGFRIANTHLTVTREGESTPEQRADAAKMLTFAKTEAERAGGLLLCGDFNAPRGRATFSLIAESFIDGIPAHYTTSIDGSLHRAGQLPYMVDGLFHTPTYKLENATLHSGVSDHMALTATLSHVS
jgi:endonuclease/exonuclease/phosphatase family metal-dependent hydrolase